MNYIDMHCDTLMQAFLLRKDDIYTIEKTMADVKRMLAGGTEAQFFAIFMPPMSFRKKMGEGIPADDEYIRILREILWHTLEVHSDALAWAGSFADLEKNRIAGKCSAFLTIEDGRPVDGKMEKLEEYYNMGVRLISLTWNEQNCFGFPNSVDPEIMAAGLTAFGKEAVMRMNEMGMLVDVSHLSDGGFWDVVQICKSPFVASHSNCRALSPHTRNLTDEMICALADHGGVAGINFGPEFLHQDTSRKDSTVEAIIAQVRHMMSVGGEECVAIGTDFDGVTGTFEVGSPDRMNILFDALKKAGFHERQIERLARGNIRRVLKDVLT
ncbi:MAG: dipeptidase [Lachnospiraceae bacterium]|nr:dipeptidase [Lachnospiraceae bacterium]